MSDRNHSLRAVVWQEPYAPIRITTWSGKSWRVEHPEKCFYYDGELIFDSGDPQRPRIALDMNRRIANIERIG